jgi:hypothetical protein
VLISRLYRAAERFNRTRRVLAALFADLGDGQSCYLSCGLTICADPEEVWRLENAYLAHVDLDSFSLLYRKALLLEQQGSVEAALTQYEDCCHRAAKEGCPRLPDPDEAAVIPERPVYLTARAVFIGELVTRMVRMLSEPALARAMGGNGCQARASALLLWQFDAQPLLLQSLPLVAWVMRWFAARRMQEAFRAWALATVSNTGGSTYPMRWCTHLMIVDWAARATVLAALAQYPELRQVLRDAVQQERLLPEE